MILGDEILLYDQIVGEDDFGVTASHFAAELRELSGVRDITIRINSPGGSLFAGLAMYESILAARRLGQNITAVIDGGALSIASAIPLAANKVVMGSAAVMMLHNPWVPNASGNAADLRKTIATLEKATETLVGIYIRKTGKPKKVITDWLAAETWFTAQEAVAAGLADEVSGAMPRLAALCNLGEYRVPDRILNEIRQPVQKLINETVRECYAARTAECYDDAVERKTIAADAAERLTRTPGATTHDLAIVAQCLERTDVWANYHNWNHYDYR